MKIILSILLTLFTGACTTQNHITFSYSGTFKSQFPASMLSGSTIFSADALSFKTQDGKVISAVATHKDIDKIPRDFDMRDYPKILFGLKNPSNQDSELIDKLIKTNDAYKEIYDLDNVNVETKNGVTRYTTCKDTRCLGFIVKDSLTDHVLMVFSEGIARNDFIETINGAFYVK